MNISVALKKIYASIKAVSGTSEVTERVLQKLEKLDGKQVFSVSASQRALKNLLNDPPPSGFLDIDTYLKEVAERLIGYGRVLHDTCDCGKTLQHHIDIFFQNYIFAYIDFSFPQESTTALLKISDAEVEIEVELKTGIIDELLKYPPSLN